MMAVVPLSTTASLSICLRFKATIIYSSPFLVSKWAQFSVSRPSRQCRRYLNSSLAFPVNRHGSSYLSRQNPVQRLSRSAHCPVVLLSSISSSRLPRVHCSGLATLASSQQVIEGDISVQYRHGLPVLALTLPSRGERCEFALRPITETVADLCDYIRREDRGVDTIGLYTPDGAKIAGSTSIEHLMQSDFHVRLNDRLYLARPPKHASLTAEHIQQLNDVKALVASLHASLNADEQCLRMEREIVAKLETVRQALEPLEKQKQLLVLESDKRTNRLLWLGLALMGVQLGAFARLTWFEYSWDIMEPVTYFATYTAIIGGYAYFVATRIQYEYPDAKERILLNKFHKLCRKKGFDVENYNRTKECLCELEKDLERLRRQPTFASHSNTPLVGQTITVVRDAKPQSTQSAGSRTEREPATDSKNAAHSDAKGV